MKRALLAVLALCWVGEAAARVALIDKTGDAASKYQMKMVQGVFERLGVEYDVIPVKFGAVKTLWVATGQIPTGRGSAVTTYHAVVHVNYDNGSTPVTGYSPDSLTRVVHYPRVPQIFLNAHAANPFNQSTFCSTGVAGPNLYAGTLAEYGYSAYRVGGTERWKFDGWSRAIVDTGTFVNNDDGETYEGQIKLGGFRPLVATSMTPASDTLCHDCDSIVTNITGNSSVTTPATVDTLLMWETPNRHIAGASSNIFAMWAGSATALDVPLLVMALARADSLSGGNVFTRKRTLPLKAGIHIDDGWRRGSQHLPSGIAFDDSAALKGSIDSIAAYRIPVVVGAQVDSMRALAGYDSVWWERAAPYVHYTPHTHSGFSSPLHVANSGLGRDSIHDTWGGARARKLYVGEECNTNTDTSYYCLKRYELYYLERSFPGRVDRIGMPPTDDWTMATVTKNSAGATTNPGIDSLLWTLWRAGYRGVRAASGSVGTVSGNSGYQTNYREFPIYQSAPPGRPNSTVDATAERSGSSQIGTFRVLVTPGYMLTGSASYLGWTTQNNFHRSWLAGIQALDTQPAATSLNELGPKQIMALHVSDLGGAAANGVKKRPGWWQIKYLATRIAATNAFAGRSVLQIDYPENITR